MFNHNHPCIENQLIEHIVSCKNEVSLGEIKPEINEKDGVFYHSHHSVRIKKPRITRKRLSLIPMEINSRANIDWPSYLCRRNRLI